MSADTDTGPDVQADASGDGDIDADADADVSTANTMRERANENRVKLWLLLGANRLLVTGLLAALVFGILLAAGMAFLPSFLGEIRNQDLISTIFSTMVSVIITVTTLVVTINQLVISQENGPLGDQHERMSGTMNVREFTGELVGQPVPADPSAFLRLIVEETEDRARTLCDAITAGEDHGDELRAEVDEFTDSIIGNAEEVADQLDGATFGTFDVLFAALNYNYGWKVFQTERIEHEYGDQLTDEAKTVLEELRTTVSMFGPAREHIKTLYFEWALIDLSQLILYLSVPALVVAGFMLLFVDKGSFVGATLGIPHILLVTVTAFTVTALPFLLLVSYIARVTTIAKRTLAIGPFILRESQR